MKYLNVPFSNKTKQMKATIILQFNKFEDVINYCLISDFKLLSIVLDGEIGS